MKPRYQSATVNGIRMHFASRGEGKTVILLHGFPETHRSWDLQASFLAESGFHVVTPDLRGYGGSERPLVGYELENLAHDVVALIDELGGSPVSLVGHDWGGAISWQLATHHGDKLDKLVVLDCPHPAIMARHLRANLRQIRRSWYMFFFQLPKLPELWLTRREGHHLARMFRAGSPGARFAPAELIEAQKRTLLEPDAASAALAYYRAAFRDNLGALFRGNLDDDYPAIRVPVTLIWGEADSCLGLELIDGTEKFASDLEVHRIPDAGHFVHQERPELVNPLLLNALRGEPSALSAGGVA